MSVMGLDLGGSGAKAIVFDAGGAILARAKSEYALVSPRPGWLEFDPNLQWKCLREAVRQVTAEEAVRHDRVRALGISVAGEAVLPIDRHGIPLYNSIATPDPRGSEQLEWWEQQLSAERIYAITGQPLDGIYSLVRVLWFREFMPDVFARAWKFVLWQEYVLMRLGVFPSLDYSNASRTMAFDIRACDWSPEILEVADLDPAQFSPLAPSGTVLGRLDESIGVELGLDKGTLVVSAGFDQCCAALGAGVINEGMCSIGTGSVEAVGVAAARPLLSDSLRLGNFCTCVHMVPGLYLTIGVSFAAGSLFSWYADMIAVQEREIARSRQLSIYNVIAESMPDEPTRLLVLPHFNGAFTPIRDARSRGAILGLKIDTTRGEMARAILEGTAFELRRIITYLEADGVQLKALRNTGGGSNSPKWLQIKADVLNRPVTPVRVRDSSCLGGAIHAAVVCGEHSDLASAVEGMVRLDRTYEPDRRRAALYTDRYELYQDLYQAIAPFHHHL